MFEKLKNLFGGQKESVQAREMTLAEVGPWLDDLERWCTERRTQAMNTSRDTIISHRDTMMTLIHEFGVESSDDQPHHHKVEQVNRLALPQFCKRMESELEITFSADDEVFYQEVAGMVQGCFKAYRGPGRYLHHLYPDEVRVFRETLDAIGRELNRLTAIVRSSRERLGEIAKIRDELTAYTNEDGEWSRLAGEAEEIRSRIAGRDEERSHLQAARESLLSSPAYESLLALRNDHARAMDLVHTRKETLDAFFRTALPVWRKGERIFHDTGNDTGMKEMEELIRLSSHHEYGNEDLPVLIRKTADPLFDEIASGAIPVKNTFEKGLFTTAGEYTSRLETAVTVLLDAGAEVERLANLIAADPAGKQITDLDRQIEDVSRDIVFLTGEADRISERSTHLKNNLEATDKRIRELVSGISEEPVVLQLMNQARESS